MRYGLSADLVTNITPCSLDKGCCTFGFLISIIPERSFLYHSPYILRKIVKAPLLHQSLGPRVFFVSLSLSLSVWFSGAWRPVVLTFLPRLLRSSQEDTLCLHPLEGAPGAFVSDASPMSRALLVLCVNQRISASFSFLLSYHQLCTTRFRSIKGPQQVAPRTGTLSCGISGRVTKDLLR